MKKPLAAALLTATAVAALVAPAGAAVTKKPSTATQVVPCNDGSGQSARLWYYSQADWYQKKVKSWAADNPCRRWLIIGLGGASESDPYGTGLSVAPGAHFQRSSTTFFTDFEEPSVYLSDTRMEECHAGWQLYEVRKNDHGKFRLYKECPGSTES